MLGKLSQGFDNAAAPTNPLVSGIESTTGELLRYGAGLSRAIMGTLPTSPSPTNPLANRSAVAADYLSNLAGAPTPLPDFAGKPLGYFNPDLAPTAIKPPDSIDMQHSPDSTRHGNSAGAKEQGRNTPGNYSLSLSISTSTPLGHMDTENASTTVGTAKPFLGQDDPESVGATDKTEDGRPQIQGPRSPGYSRRESKIPQLQSTQGLKGASSPKDIEGAMALPVEVINGVQKAAADKLRDDYIAEGAILASAIVGGNAQGRRSQPHGASPMGLIVPDAIDLGPMDAAAGAPGPSNPGTELPHDSIFTSKAPGRSPVTIVLGGDGALTLGTVASPHPGLQASPPLRDFVSTARTGVGALAPVLAGALSRVESISDPVDSKASEDFHAKEIGLQASGLARNPALLTGAERSAAPSAAPSQSSAQMDRNSRVEAVMQGQTRTVSEEVSVSAWPLPAPAFQKPSSLSSAALLPERPPAYSSSSLLSAGLRDISMPALFPADGAVVAPTAEQATKAAHVPEPLGVPPRAFSQGALDLNTHALQQTTEAGAGMLGKPESGHSIETKVFSLSPPVDLAPVELPHQLPADNIIPSPSAEAPKLYVSPDPTSTHPLAPLPALAGSTQSHVYSLATLQPAPSTPATVQPAPSTPTAVLESASSMESVAPTGGDSPPFVVPTLPPGPVHGSPSNHNHSSAEKMSVRVPSTRYAAGPSHSKASKPPHKGLSPAAPGPTIVVSAAVPLPSTAGKPYDGSREEMLNSTGPGNQEVYSLGQLRDLTGEQLSSIYKRGVADVPGDLPSEKSETRRCFKALSQRMSMSQSGEKELNG